MIENKYLNYLVIILFIGMWISIGSDPYNYLFIFEKDNYENINLQKINIKNTLNFLRALFPIFSLIVSGYVVFKFKLFQNQKKFIYVIFLIQIIQIFTTIISRNSIMSNYEILIDHIGRYHWIISSISTVLIFMISSKLKNFKFKYFFYISSSFLGLMVIYFSTKIIIDFYTSDIEKSVYHLSVLRESAFFLDHQIPRTTGLSRSIIFLYIILFFLKDYIGSFLKYINYLILVVLGALVFFYQSKFAFISYIIINIIFVLTSSEKLSTLRIILFLFLIQVCFFYSLSSSRIIFNKISLEFNSNNLLNSKENSKNSEKKNKEFKHFRQFGDTRKSGMDQVQNIISSGRFSLWEKAFIYIKKRPFLGYGSMSDRHIINEKRLKNQNLVNPVSNAFLYSLISGGLVTLFLFIFFWISIIKKNLNLFKLNNITNYNIKVSTIIIFIIGLRCIVENSIMLFGVDYILILNFLYLSEEV